MVVTDDDELIVLHECDDVDCNDITDENFLLDDEVVDEQGRREL